MTSNLKNYHATKVIASYRMPRENGQPSRILTAHFDGETFTFKGGKWGPHSIAGDDRKRAYIHWAGYVGCNMGRVAKPAGFTF